ncbi:glycosyltransferase [Veillonella criceti]|uniref:Hyaluronan synthase n=1 Tax=Veillonella criceti TaxID=103891 RepID=A0A380NCJ0_9FIRM|nr:glycosyltransferase [Veillonella criceti]SUP37235.1 Hyaluronan synthase [Veillonella criceti]
MEDKLLSVIIPVYKVEKYLQRCVDSVLSQTYKNLEVILVDDGSPDRCGQICDEYLEKDNRIVVLHQENQGPSGARNNGLSIAKGEYIAFVDSDDWLDTNMYKSLIELIETYDLDMARCSVNISDGISKSSVLPKGNIINKVIKDDDVFELYFTEFLCKIVWNVVYKRNIIEGILSPERCHAQDNYVSGRYLYRTKRLMISDQCLYYYFTNPAGITNGGQKRLLDICICSKLLRDDLVKHEGLTKELYIQCLNRKLARELFHFIRAKSEKYRIKSVDKEQYKFINTYLDFGRKIRFNFSLKKKGIKVM